jgi:hypothetical protein
MRHKSDVIAARILKLVTRCVDVRWVFVLVLALVGSATAGEYRGTEEQRVACTGDVFRLCFSEVPNVSRIVGCLQREKQQLSSGCRAVFDHNSNVRLAYDRWQHRHHRLASDRLQPTQPTQQSAQTEHRNEIATVASVEPAVTGSVTPATDHHASSIQQAKGQRSEIAPHRSHKRTKIALHHLHGKHRVGHHRSNHRYAMVVGKRHHLHIHRG